MYRLEFNNKILTEKFCTIAEHGVEIILRSFGGFITGHCVPWSVLHTVSAKKHALADVHYSL